jgi:hypothetical protein
VRVGLLCGCEGGEEKGAGGAEAGCYYASGCLRVVRMGVMRDEDMWNAIVRAIVRYGRGVQLRFQRKWMYHVSVQNLCSNTSDVQSYPVISLSVFIAMGIVYRWRSYMLAKCRCRGCEQYVL